MSLRILGAGPQIRCGRCKATAYITGASPRDPAHLRHLASRSGWTRGGRRMDPDLCPKCSKL